MFIDEKTRISLYAVATCVPFVFGGVLWLAAIDFKASAAESELKSTSTMLIEIRERLVRIEQKLTDRSER